MFTNLYKKTTNKPDAFLDFNTKDSKCFFKEIRLLLNHQVIYRKTLRKSKITKNSADIFSNVIAIETSDFLFNLSTLRQA